MVKGEALLFLAGHFFSDKLFTALPILYAITMMEAMS
jgi:hypothetical protein